MTNADEISRRLKDAEWRQEHMYKAQSGKQTIRLSGLLDLAHLEGLSSLDTQCLEIPRKENGETAIFRCVATTKRGTFSGHGKGSPGDTKGKPPMEMAESRSIVRALRFAVNYGTPSLEELDGREDEDVEMSQPPAAAEKLTEQVAHEVAASRENATAPDVEVVRTIESERQAADLQSLQRGCKNLRRDLSGIIGVEEPVIKDLMVGELKLHPDSTTWRGPEYAKVLDWLSNQIKLAKRNQASQPREKAGTR